MPDGQGLRPCRAAFRFPSGRAEVGGRSGVSVGSARPSSCAGANEAASARALPDVFHHRMFFRSRSAPCHSPQAPSCMHFCSTSDPRGHVTLGQLTGCGASSIHTSSIHNVTRATRSPTLAHGRFECLTHTATNRGTTDHNESYRNTEPVGLTQRPAATLLPPPRRAERSLDAALHA